MAGRHHNALGYADEVDIENFLLIDIDSAFSAQVEDWIAAAESHVNQYLGYTTASGIMAEELVDEVSSRSYIDSNGDLKVFPRKTPIQSVTSLGFIRGSNEANLTLTTTGGVLKYQIPDTRDFISYPAYEQTFSGTIMRDFSAMRYGGNFTKMSYIGGYREVPPDIRLATVMLVADHIMRQSNKEGLEQITQGRVTKRWRERKEGQSDFYVDAMTLLRPYRLAAAWLL